MKTALFAFVLALQTPAAGLNGIWALDKAASHVPREIGFNPAWLSGGADREPAPASSGGRGRRGSAGGSRSGGAFRMPSESYEDARRAQLLTSEVRNPPARLTIVETPDAVTFTTELGATRTVHPTGRQESIEIEGLTMPVTATRDADRLVIDYHVAEGRDVRYAFSRNATSSQLLVDIEFVERGSGDTARFVYDAGRAAGTPAASATAVAAPAQKTEPFDERPGAELRGIKTLGVLVEDVSAQAMACGLNRDAIEDALAKRLAAAGFDVRRNSDDDTYVYANVMTNTLPNGTCVSRYDAFLYTHATANLSYRDRPALVQVSLIHRGGIGASALPGHAAAVTRALEAFVDLFAGQIRDASQ